MHPRVVLSVGNFLFALASVALLYVLLPYLTTFMSAAHAGIVLAVASLVTLIGFLAMPALTAKIGSQQLALILCLLEILALLAIAIAPAAITGIFFVAATTVLAPFIAYELDLLLEATVQEENTTGRVRTIFLTAAHVAAIGGPLLIGILLASTDAYSRVFLAAAGILLPFLALFAARQLPKGIPPRLSHLKDTLVCITHDRDLAATTCASFVLSLFYIWAPLYVPVYLHNVLHIGWETLGWIFALMLVPFVILEYPAGVIADRWLGDKEMLIAGFLIAGAALAAVGAIGPTTPVWTIVFILVGSRIGASFIESMTEAHFFRRVSERDVNSISVFRLIWPLAGIVGPLMGTAFLLIGGYHFLFVVTGALVLIAGTIAALCIRDFTPEVSNENPGERLVALG